MENSAAARCLALPEMFRMIMEKLSDIDVWHRRSLLSAALVNRDWADQALDVLWHTSAPGYFATISKERRQLYANRVRALHLGTSLETDCVCYIDGLSFPLLRSLCSRRTREWPVQRCNPCLGMIRDWLESILRLSTRMQVLNITDDYAEWFEEELILFLPKQRDLIELTIALSDTPYLPPISDTLFSHIAGHPRMKRLVVRGRIVSDAAIEAVMNDATAPFPCLEDISIVISPSPHWPLLLSTIANLRRVALLVLEAHDARLLLQLSSLKSLIGLDLCYYSDVFMDKEQLLALRSFTQLRRLVITKWPREPITAVGWDVADLAAVLRHLARLEQLALPVKHLVIDHQFLVSLGSAHRRLKFLCLSGHLDFQALGDANMLQPLFPCLVSLEVDSLGHSTSPGNTNSSIVGMNGYEIYTIQQVFRLLRPQAPALIGLTVPSIGYSGVRLGRRIYSPSESWSDASARCFDELAIWRSDINDFRFIPAFPGDYP